MSNQWVVLEDETKYGKRFVSIEDTVNKIKYSNYFPLSSPDAVVIERFKNHVKERRLNQANRQITLDLTNFEAGL